VIWVALTGLGHVGLYVSSAAFGAVLGFAALRLVGGTGRENQ
jgi:hypothetical protein